jgi:hypothetical protein
MASTIDQPCPADLEVDAEVIAELLSFSLHHGIDGAIFCYPQFTCEQLIEVYRLSPGVRRRLIRTLMTPRRRGRPGVGRSRRGKKEEPGPWMSNAIRAWEDAGD